MELKTYLDRERGRTSELARKIGAHASDVSAWKGGTRPVPVHFGLPIETATGGQVTRLELFPKEVIAQVWPELLTKQRRAKKLIERVAASDDTQPPVGGPPIDVESTEINPHGTIRFHYTKED
jgi:DNA-binding transcriptional regulator YdaS (Cro superfamily)